MSFFEAMRQRWSDPARVALITDEATVTYGELEQRVGRAIGWLRAQGVGPGDVVGLQMPRSLAMLELHLANLALGSVTLPMNRAYTPGEVAYLLTDSRAKLAILPAETHPALDVPAALHAPGDLRAALDACAPGQPGTPEDRDIAVVCYTSGTTGSPKGACITHGNLQAITRALHEAWHWRADDVLLHALPLFHIHGLFVAQHGALWADARTVWMPRFDAEQALADIEAHRATVFMGVPTFYHRFLAIEPSEADLSSMRLFTSGSAPLPAEVHVAFRERYGHVVLERYGMTEIGIALSNPYALERRPGAVGFPLPGVEARIADPDTDAPLEPGSVGEVQVRGPTVFPGYLGRPEATASALRGGWMHSGDLGFVDADGYFHIVGRAKDMVLSGGLNVYPREIETVLCEHPDIAEAAVVGVPDPDLGERVVASVVTVAGRPLPESALRQLCHGQLADYKRPKAFERLDELPRNTMGKVQKSELRKRWARARVAPLASADVAWFARCLDALSRESEGEPLDEDAALRGVTGLLHHEEGASGFVARWAGKRVGTVALTREWSDWRGVRVFWLQSLFVDPAYRRRGIARVLVDHARSFAAANRAELRLYVDADNVAGQALYASLGWKETAYRVWADPGVGAQDAS